MLKVTGYASGAGLYGLCKLGLLVSGAGAPLAFATEAIYIGGAGAVTGTLLWGESNFNVAMNLLIAIEGIRSFASYAYEYRITRNALVAAGNYVRQSLAHPPHPSQIEITGFDVPDIILESQQSRIDSTGTITVKNIGSSEAKVSCFIDI